MKKILLIIVMALSMIPMFSVCKAESNVGLILGGNKELVPVEKWASFSYLSNIKSNSYVLISGSDFIFAWKNINGEKNEVIYYSSLPINKIRLQYDENSTPKIKFRWISGNTLRDDVKGAMDNVIYAVLILKK